MNKFQTESLGSFSNIRKIQRVNCKQSLEFFVPSYASLLLKLCPENREIKAKLEYFKITSETRLNRFRILCTESLLGISCKKAQGVNGLFLMFNSLKRHPFYGKYLAISILVKTFNIILNLKTTNTVLIWLKTK